MNILDILKENNPQAILWDDLDNALIGYTEDYVAVYSIQSIIKCLMENNTDWSEEDACEWYGFNISQAYVGENTPIHIHTI
jgi:hypothetical protein